MGTLSGDNMNSYPKTAEEGNGSDEEVDDSVQVNYSYASDAWSEKSYNVAGLIEIRRAFDSQIDLFGIVVLRISAHIGIHRWIGNKV